MSHQQTGEAWWSGFGGNDGNPEALGDLAKWCEQLGPHEQRRGFDRVLRQFADFGNEREEELKSAAIGWIVHLVDTGAFESAAIAMIPHDAIFTGGRLKDGSFIAQVILEGGSGAHSRDAASLPMAWMAALLRALARQGVEQRAATSH
ncbi:hypothetical protein [Novosphingobium taihuense]|uniref:Uncharacterized protein n=1 Tax=Novosphingobium taihuense TaxID=260085 RepID=A0A7W7A991_9SPHN|nr:hypothetical protein [Novosphingobium taihuense]MBB4612789.1 hypothetical protein [Novosphingobium taihuense]TWH80300.1 hypothetical protein IQ25_03761 [Novosphingobium taihuense]